MRYFINTQFIENGQTIDLISIGIVSTDDREYYAINRNCDLMRATNWVKDNVIEQLPSKEHPAWKTKKDIRQDILEFVHWFPDKPHFGPSFKPEFWGWYSSTTWVTFYQLYGTLMDLPEAFPKHCNDIKQWCDALGNPRLPQQTKRYHALEKAKWNKQAWEFLQTYSEDCAVEHKQSRF